MKTFLDYLKDNEKMCTLTPDSATGYTVSKDGSIIGRVERMLKSTTWVFTWGDGGSSEAASRREAITALVEISRR